LDPGRHSTFRLAQAAGKETSRLLPLRFPLIFLLALKPILTILSFFQFAAFLPLLAFFATVAHSPLLPQV
jgi:hypothetical protein